MTYRPSSVIQDKVVLDEFQRLAAVLNRLGAERIDFRYVPPERPRLGDIAICDGVEWDPLGDGIPQPIWYDGTNWVAVAGAGGGGGGVTDHGALTGLGDDDHTQYHNDTRGDARYSLLGHTHTASQVTDFNAAADARIAAASVNALADVTVTAPSAGQVLKWNGSAWINDTDATGGGSAESLMFMF